VVIAVIGAADEDVRAHRRRARRTHPRLPRRPPRPSCRSEPRLHRRRGSGSAGRSRVAAPRARGESAAPRAATGA
jgi:hypothetical protein